MPEEKKEPKPAKPYELLGQMLAPKPKKEEEKKPSK